MGLFWGRNWSISWKVDNYQINKKGYSWLEQLGDTWCTIVRCKCKHFAITWVHRNLFLSLNAGTACVTVRCALLLWSYLVFSIYSEPLQCVLNAAARLVLNLRLHEHTTPALQQLHWLPIDYRIAYKLWLIMHLVHTSCAPQYLLDCVQTVARSSRRPGLRSSDTAAYVKPRCRTKFGERGFCYAGPAAWNSLPHHHQITDTGLFKRRLNVELFRRAYHC